MPPRKTGGENKKNVLSDPMYVQKRRNNNDAVKKSREKTKLKVDETKKKVDQLKYENEELEKRINLLSKELTFLRDIFLAHASGTHGVDSSHLGLNNLLKNTEAVMESWAEKFWEDFPCAF